MRRYTALLLALPLVAFAGTAKQEAGKPAPKLWAAISVSHPVFDKGVTGDPFMIHFALVNDGDKTINPDVESSRLLVNGKDLKGWDFIIANGIRDDSWYALPPGDYLAFGYALGERFEKPGVYKVSWKGKGFASNEIVFRVHPTKGP